MKKVLWLTNIPSPYRVRFFNELGQQCDLTVLFEKAFSEERDDVWKEYSFEHFNGVISKSIRVTVHTALSFSFREYIMAYRNEIIIVGNPATPIGVSAILYMQLHKIRYSIESDGAFPNKKKGYKRYLKHILYSRAKFCFTTSEYGKEYFKNYGVLENRIYKYPFSSIDKYYLAPQVLTQSEKNVLREQLGIEGKKVLISVGQFIYRKGFDILLEAIHNTNTLFNLYIVGDSPTKEYMDYCKAHNLTNVRFVPFMKPPVLRQWLLASDVFVLPTREDIWGLVVNEAMACGLPVITTKRCMAGLEMVVNGVNGLLVDVNNPEQLRNAIMNVIDNNIQTMSEEALKKASCFTIEAMTMRHLELFELLY